MNTEAITAAFATSFIFCIALWIIERLMGKRLKFVKEAEK